MVVAEFNDVYLQNILEKLSYENNKIRVMGNFNIDILKYNTNSNSAIFLDNMYENLLLLYVTSPTRVTPRTDNIFSNKIEEDMISGNITTTISDHYVQFVLFKDKIK